MSESGADATAERRGLQGWLGSLWMSLSGIGLVIGAVFFAFSLTPSLIPRAGELQGVLGGISFAIGYGIGTLAGALWRWFQLPVPPDRIRRPGTWIALGASALVVAVYLWRSSAWQNSIRSLMGMPPVDSSAPLRLALVAIAVVVIAMLLARLFLFVIRLVEERAVRHMSLRAARALGLIGAALIFLLVVEGVLVRGFLNMADASFRAVDAIIEPNVARPADPLKTGSSASLVRWEGIGRAGRDFIASGPTAAQISAETGVAAKEPIRVYVGLNSAEGAEARARLALRELIRAGAFDRSVLVVVTPTGTGWMDPAAMDTLEYLQHGDTAIVGQQYSYLTSWISLLVEPDNSVEAARALLSAVYQHWTHLPRDHRPKLYLQGLSLGAYGSDQSFRLHEVLADPFNGAVWSGPPFSTPGWSSATSEREPDSPEWLPRFGDGSVIRFTNQQDHTHIPGATWGPLRIVYLQYASDPITFFQPAAIWRKPDWMNAPLGPDVSPYLSWYPVVSFLQLTLDMAIALAVPIGHGHYFAPEHYIDAWVAVTEPTGWTPDSIARLKTMFGDKRGKPRG
ncbi:putative membrane protein [Amaricoccus macauensis]|uniref:Putative membrane protein n=1 Tax=Amaricoccus macauensis TaxID=57001 RepID=A0A840SP68_9RHOB|nr:putative membrane protein [Amaricoccus macauensis]